MAFIVLEGYSGTGKTTLSRGLERRGWLRFQESAHALPDHVPVADRGDTFSDYSLFGATLSYSSAISRLRGTRNLVSEGYLLSDLAYAKVRFGLKKSGAYPALLALCREALKSPRLRPDLYIALKAGHGTVKRIQAMKSERDREMAGIFRESYYEALAEVHRVLGESMVETLIMDTDPKVTLRAVLAIIENRNVISP